MTLVRLVRMNTLGGLLLVAGTLGLCGCVGDPTQPDEFEPNSVAAPSALGNFSDSGTFRTFDLTLHDAADEDAFALTISDGGIDGNPLQIAISEFAFIGGSMGSVYGERLARAAERAAHHVEAQRSRVIERRGRQVHTGLIHAAHG